ncbi:universal stress protein [Maribacter sp. 2210JD10-5]|uniref:universal stress protein n=1 Tax=Maribacter sp. 2210JD10-5 TaxID=3386272 RepID=UPI0039BC35E3
MKTILYATDCSTHDTDTLHYAHELCGHLKLNLTLLHIYQIPPIQVSTIRPRKHLSAHAHDEQLTLLEEYASKHLKDSKLNTKVIFEVVENSSVSDGILSKTRELSPELLLIGMKDEHTARGIFSGSIAKALFEKVRCPLLTVPNSHRFKRLETIVYATDFEEDDIYAIRSLVKIAEPSNASLNIVHIATEGERDANDQMEWFKEMLRQKVTYDHIIFDITSDDTVYDGIRSYISSKKADLLVLLEREEKGFLNKLFHKDLTKKIESNINIPLLSFNQVYV